MKMLGIKSIWKNTSKTITTPIKEVTEKHQFGSQCCMIVYSSTWDLIRTSLITTTKELIYREKY